APSGVCRQAASRRETTTASRDRVKRFWCIIGGIIPVYTEVVNETILLTASGTVRTSTRTDQESGYAPFVRCPELWHNRARLYPESSLLAYSRSRRACPRGRRAPRRQGDEHGGPAGGVGSEGGDQRVCHRRRSGRHALAGAARRVREPQHPLSGAAARPVQHVLPHPGEPGGRARDHRGEGGRDTANRAHAGDD